MECEENETMQQSSLSFRRAFKGLIGRSHVTLHCNKFSTVVNIWPELQNKISQLAVRPHGLFLFHFFAEVHTSISSVDTPVNIQVDILPINISDYSTYRGSSIRNVIVWMTLFRLALH